MKRKTRRLFFYGAILFFVLIGYAAVLFALGYKYDFIQNKLLKTGSLEIKSNVSVEIYINDELAGGSSFLGNSYSRGRLLPRTYRVRLEKENYQSWQKLVKIEAGFLIDFPRVVLISEAFEEEFVASSSISGVTIKKFDKETGVAIIGNKQKLEAIDLESGTKELLKNPDNGLRPASNGAKINYLLSSDEEKNAWFSGYEAWVRWVKDASYQPFKKAGDTEFVTRFSQKIDDIQWYKDSSHLIISVGGILKLVEIDDRGGINIFDISTVSGPFYYDRDQDAIFKFEGNMVVRISLSK